MTTTKKILLGFVLFGVTIPPVTGADLDVTAQADRARLRLGEELTVTVRVRGASGEAAVKAPRVDGLTIVPLGQPQRQPSLLARRGSQTQLPLRLPGSGKGQLQELLGSLRQLQSQIPLQGQERELLQTLMDQSEAALGKGNQDGLPHAFRIRAARPGSYTLPPFEAVANRQTGKSAPLTFTVVDTDQPRVKAVMALARADAVAGETVPLHLEVLVERRPVLYGTRAYTHLPLRNVHLSVPPLARPPILQPAQALDQVAAGMAATPGKRGFKVNEIPKEVLFAQDPGESARDPGWFHYRLAVPVTLGEPGEIEFAPLRVTGEVYVPLGTGTAGAATPGRWDRFSVASPPLRVTVAQPQAAKAGSGQPGPATEDLDLPPLPDLGGAEGSSTARQLAWLVGVVGTSVFLLWLGARLARRYHHWPVKAQRRQEVAAQVRQRLRQPSLTPAQVRYAVHDLLRRRYGLPAGEITPNEAGAALRGAGVDAGLTLACVELLRECAAAEFAPGLATLGDKELTARLDRLLPALDRQPVGAS